MRILILVYNPAAGDAYFKHQIDKTIELFRQHRCFIIPFRAVDKGENMSFIRLAKQVGAAGIIAAGGDGTVHEVINAMVTAGLDLPLGIIPCGTSNDFATHLGMGESLAKSVSTIARGYTKLVDLGQANDRYFINVASAGLLTGVAHTVDTALKNTLGKIAYYLKGLGELPNFRSIRARITADDWQFDDDIFLVLVMNSSTVGAFPNVLPVAKIDDGKLDLLIVPKCSATELVALLIRLFTGSSTIQKNVIHRQAEQIYIESDEQVESDLDGEHGPVLPLQITVIPQRIRLFHLLNE